MRRSVAVWPTLVFYDGEPIPDALARHHLLEDDLYTAARQQGMGSLEGVHAVLLESNGAFTVLSKSQYGGIDGGESPVARSLRRTTCRRGR